MIRFSVLGSGSGGNATLVASETAKILVDAGLSFRQLRLRAAHIGETLDGITAVFITHEHADHVSGLGTLARNLRVPVHMTSGTHAALPAFLGHLPRVELFDPGDTVVVDGLSVGSYTVSHDAVDPVSFVIAFGRTKLGIAADLGHAPQLVRSRLAGSHGLILESNYCPRMLSEGAYPPAVQQRIRSRHGHLSNNDMCSLLADLIHEELKVVVLSHLSQENNEANLALAMAARTVCAYPTQIVVARQDRPTPMLEL